MYGMKVWAVAGACARAQARRKAARGEGEEKPKTALDRFQ
jgi:hypothetical protein